MLKGVIVNNISSGPFRDCQEDILFDGQMRTWHINPF